MPYTRDEIRSMVDQALREMPWRPYAFSVGGRKNVFNLNTPRYANWAAERLIEVWAENNGQLSPGVGPLRHQEFKLDKELRENTAPEQPEDVVTRQFARTHWFRGETRHPVLGWAVAIQVPLNQVQTDSLGKIDLIFFDESRNQLNLIEVKRPRSNDSVLVASLQAYYYGRQLAAEFQQELVDWLRQQGIKPAITVGTGRMTVRLWALLGDRVGGGIYNFRRAGDGHVKTFLSGEGIDVKLLQWNGEQVEPLVD